MSNAPTHLSIPVGTLYLQGGMGFVRVEARNIKVEVKPYAQYARAVHVTYTPKGKRRERGTAQGYKPTLVVLEGHGHFSPDDPMVPTEASSPGVRTAMSRYSSCDPRWDEDFAKKLDAYLQQSGKKLLADYRGFDTGSGLSVSAPPAPLPAQPEEVRLLGTSIADWLAHTAA